MKATSSYLNRPLRTLEEYEEEQHTTGHTPGPWSTSAHSELPDRHYEITTPDSSIADVNTAEDAILIAAAPDLLEACKSCIRMFGKQYLEDDWTAITIARAAIAKASQ